MRHIYAIGETVLDIIFRNQQVKDAKPGGSMLNAAVSLGRAGMKIRLITEFANDQVGSVVQAFLEDNGVDCSYVHHYHQGKTPLAMAFLDEKSDASYVFYKDYPINRLNIRMPDFEPGDLLLFGSFFGIDLAIRGKVLEILHLAKSKGVMIIYDPNFRKAHAHELEKLKPLIIENIGLANIVRGSHEDFEIMFHAQSIENVRELTGPGPDVIIMTQSSDAVFLNSKSLNTQFPVKSIKPVSTIGAGDNFNAGLIYGLVKDNISIGKLGDMPGPEWEKIISCGVSFASDVCMSYENYISIAMAKSLK